MTYPHICPPSQRGSSWVSLAAVLDEDVRHRIVASTSSAAGRSAGPRTRTPANDPVSLGMSTLRCEHIWTVPTDTVGPCLVPARARSSRRPPSRSCSRSRSSAAARGAEPSVDAAAAAGLKACHAQWARRRRDGRRHWTRTRTRPRWRDAGRSVDRHGRVLRDGRRRRRTARRQRSRPRSRRSIVAAPVQREAAALRHDLPAVARCVRPIDLYLHDPLPDPVRGATTARGEATVQARRHAGDGRRSRPNADQRERGAGARLGPDGLGRPRRRDRADHDACRTSTSWPRTARTG